MKLETNRAREMDQTHKDRGATLRLGGGGGGVRGTASDSILDVGWAQDTFSCGSGRGP